MKISVAICTYNGEKYINEQIDSILNQTLKVDEIIVCDDRSTDKTISILNLYAIQNPNLFKINCNETKLKSVKNFEKAISLCTGDIIFLSDQDDIWTLNKVEKYIEYFDNNKKIQVVASNGYCIDKNSKVAKKYAIWDVPEFLREQNIEFSYFELITHIENIATGASMAFRKEIIMDILPFPEIKNIHHDEWIAILSAKKNAFELLNEKYFYYRIHENQQVGGVFFNKENKTKERLTNIFNLKQNDFTFINYKKRLKKLISAYNRNKTMLKLDSEYDFFFKENLVSIEKLILST
ncbi:MAG: hypothetical protein QG594_1947, partial [Bacteroidota bacterium]|nr:hypothetical protein [Bacteroidota bacterium]